MKTFAASAVMRFAVSFFALFIAASSLARAADVPLMTIKIFNDDPTHTFSPYSRLVKGSPRYWFSDF